MSIGEVTRPPASDWQSLDTGDRKVPLDVGAFSLVALGDSLTRGTGDDSGKGYVGVLKEAFEKRHDRSHRPQFRRTGCHTFGFTQAN